MRNQRDILKDPRVQEILDKTTMILSVMQEAGTGSGDGENPFQALTEVIEKLLADSQERQTAMLQMINAQTRVLNHQSSAISLQTKAIQDLMRTQQQMMDSYERIQANLGR